MAYQYTRHSDGSGAYKCLETGVTFEHAGGRHGPNEKTSAKNAYFQHAAQLKRAADQRGKPERLQVNGIVVGKREFDVMATDRASKVESVQHIGRPPADAGAAADKRQAYHERALASAKNNDERQRAMRRLAAIEQAKQRGIANQEKRDQRAAELADPNLASAIERAQQIHADLLARGDIAPEFVQMAKTNLVELKHSRDYAAYMQAEQNLQAQFDMSREAAILGAKNAVTMAKAEVKGLANIPDLVEPPAVEGEA